MAATAGPDILVGTNGANKINGLGGNDLIFGHAGQNTSPTAGTIAATRVGTGFSGAVSALAAPGDPNRLYVITKDTGQIHRLDPANGASTVFMDIPDAELTLGGEQGLLGIAFHPDYADSGATGFRKFYVHLVNSAGNVEIREYQRSAGDPALADLASMRTILTVAHNAGNHNGGSVVFGPDGYLYVSIGDSANGANSQSLANLLGKVLRLDINGDDFGADPARNYAIPADNPFAGAIAGADEIWAFGLRNPWRINFDALTGDLYIADVGQLTIEEVDFQPAASPGGENYGWPNAEGTLGTPPPGSVLPVFQYTHAVGNSITGGFVYRGPGPTFEGVYFVADFITARLWTMDIVNGVATKVTERSGQVEAAVGSFRQISSFGTDGAGNLYVVNLGGDIFRFDFSPLADDVADRLFGGPGNDRVYGGPGNDLLNGGPDNDLLSGGYGADRLYGTDGRDALNGGPGADIMGGGAGADTYLVYGAGDTVFEAAGNGRDLVKSWVSLTLGPNFEKLFLMGGAALNGTGNGLINVIVGNAAANGLIGGGAGDVLSGRFGNDTLTGGPGPDVFVFSAALSGLQNRDAILDFIPAADTIRLDNAVFTGLAGGVLAPSAFFTGPAAHDPSDRIVYDGATGNLSFDGNGSNPGGATLFAVLDAGLALTNADFFVV